MGRYSMKRKCHQSDNLINKSLQAEDDLSCHPIDQPSVSMIVERTLVLDYPVSHCPTFSVN